MGWITCLHSSMKLTTQMIAFSTVMASISPAAHSLTHTTHTALSLDTQPAVSYSAWPKRWILQRRRARAEAHKRATACTCQAQDFSRHRAVFPPAENVSRLTSQTQQARYTLDALNNSSILPAGGKAVYSPLTLAESMHMFKAESPTETTRHVSNPPAEKRTVTGPQGVSSREAACAHDRPQFVLVLTVYSLQPTIPVSFAQHYSRSGAVQLLFCRARCGLNNRGWAGHLLQSRPSSAWEIETGDAGSLFLSSSPHLSSSQLDSCRQPLAVILWLPVSADGMQPFWSGNK